MKGVSLLVTVCANTTIHELKKYFNNSFKVAFVCLEVPAFGCVCTMRLCCLAVVGTACLSVTFEIRAAGVEVKPVSSFSLEFEKLFSLREDVVCSG